MSELKAYTFSAMERVGLADYYLKSEADEVIAKLEESHKKEVGQLLMEIAEQKSEIDRLEILCANYRHDCDNLAISNEQVKRAASTLLKKMNHNKYKRCLAMARWCMARYNEWAAYYPTTTTRKMKFLDKWEKRWREIAEKFKDGK